MLILICINFTISHRKLERTVKHLKWNGLDPFIKIIPLIQLIFIHERNFSAKQIRSKSYLEKKLIGFVDVPNTLVTNNKYHSEALYEASHWKYAC